MSDKKKAFWFIALLSTLVIIPFLGETIFYSKGEPREAIVAYSMLESGNWILPLNYGTDIAYKPPFLYWSIAAISAIFGGVSEFSSRLPSAIAFLAMQFVFFGFVARYKDTKTAVITSLLLLTSFEVHRAAVACRLDMLQVSFIVISLCLLFRWDEKGCKGIPWTAVVLMACGTLTKGPVGSIFPCMCIGIYQLIRGRSFGKTFLSLFGIGLLSLIPLGIWFYAAWLQGGQPFMNLMLEENTGRFVGKMSYPSHHNPLWYNFLTIIWGWTPWTLVLLISLFGLKWNEMHLFAHFSRFCAGFGGFMSKNIAIFASGNGTNAENIIRYFQNSELVNVKLVLADRETAFVLERARRLNVPFACLGKAAWADGTAVLSLLEDEGVDFIVLAGFLARVPDCILHAYPNKIINIHPSLLPKFGGKGMYGGHVHEAVVAAGETETGITIHYLNEHFDEGEIIVQYKCPVLPQDTAEDVARKVHALEYEYYPKVIGGLLSEVC